MFQSQFFRSPGYLLLLAAGLSPALGGDPLLGPDQGDVAVAVDTDVRWSSAYPAAEGPVNILDEDPSTKYLNNGHHNAGFIVTPVESGVVKSIQFTTANDADWRDPIVWQLYGTNEEILSADNSTGEAESWTLIATGNTELTTDRLTAGPALDFENTENYTSYKVLFPVLRYLQDGFSFQVADVALFTEAGGDGVNVLTPDAFIIAVDGPLSESSHPAAEGPAQAIDGDPNTKYLNFGRQNTGLIIKPGVGSTVLDGIEFTTANDFEGRDPAVFFLLFGSNDELTSADNSTGLTENWTPIQIVALDLPADRFTSSDVIPITSPTAYSLYKIIFPTLKNVASSSMQISEIQLYGTAQAPSPLGFDISQVSYDPATSSLEVTFPSTQGANYALEASTVFSPTGQPGGWNTVGTVTAGPGEATSQTVNAATLNDGTAPDAFFLRVRRD